MRDPGNSGRSFDVRRAARIKCACSNLAATLTGRSHAVGTNASIAAIGLVPWRGWHPAHQDRRGRRFARQATHRPRAVADGNVIAVIVRSILPFV